MQQTITPDRLADALEGQDDLAVLSLDCFDTLLWRDVHKPADLFGLLTMVNVDQRKRAESNARKARTLTTRGPNEVTLREIYRAALPGADDATRDAAIAEELALEARHCHAFAPTVALIGDAKRRGLEVVVVSDTYLDHDQLQALIRAAAGDAVVAMIDRIFCSSDYRRGKNQGLFEDVLRATCARPGSILHIGDNQAADAVSPTRHGIASRHLVQFAPATLQRLRQEAAAGQLALPGAVTFLPQRAALAIGEPGTDDAAEALGFAVLGPAFARFADWVADEADAIAAQRPGRVHTVFMLRDGYLPKVVFDARFPDRANATLEISRFTATAAGLATPGQLDRYIDAEITHDVGEHFLRQLLIDDGEMRTMLGRLPRELRGHALAETLRSKSWAPKIVKRGGAFADRLIAHVRAAVDPAPGDTIMMVDLGYNGTIQDRIAPLLTDRLGVHVAGRYLLLREDWVTGLDKRGLIDARRHGDGLLKVLLRSVSVLEQLATVAHGSVVDYAADGTPRRAAPGVKGRQSDIRDRVQAGCVAFARVEAAATVRPADPARATTRDHGAIAALMRFLTLPLPHEVALLDGFQHDGNLGGDYVVPLFDRALCATGLRERGLFYLRDAERMFLPGELSGQGLATSLTHLAARRFDLDLIHADFCDSTIDLPLFVADGTEAFHDRVAATPTHDGFYCAAIPAGANRFTIGVHFGLLYEWVEIQSVRFVPVEAYFRHGALFDHLAAPAAPSLEGMTQAAPHLFRCDAREAFLMVPPPEDPGGRALTLLVAFRPIVAREPVTQPQTDMVAR